MNSYTVTQISDAAKNEATEIQKARALAYRLGGLRKDLWNKFGGVQAWGAKPDKLLKEFKLTHPPENYRLE